MYVAVTRDGAAVSEPDDCTSLDVRVAPSDRPRLAAVLGTSGLGRWDGGAEAELGVDALREQAARGDVGPDWPQRWAAMIDYAQRKGWLTPDSTHVRAHLVDAG